MHKINYTKIVVLIMSIILIGFIFVFNLNYIKGIFYKADTPSQITTNNSAEAPKTLANATNDDCSNMESDAKTYFDNLRHDKLADKYLRAKYADYFDNYFADEDLNGARQLYPEEKNLPYSSEVNGNKGIAKFSTDNGYDVEVKVNDFNFANHKISKNSEGGICKIDGKFFFGVGDFSDFPIRNPANEIESIKVKFNGVEVVIPNNEYSDIFNTERISFKGAYYLTMRKDQNDKSYTSLVFEGGDGGGGYSAVWIFKDGKYYGRTVEHIGG